MTPDDFKAWRKALNLTQQQAADELGVTRRALIYWEDGARPISRSIALACAALAAGLGPWVPPRRST